MIIGTNFHFNLKEIKFKITNSIPMNINIFVILNHHCQQADK